MNFNLVMSMVLKFLGIKTFKKDAESKMVLEEAQEQKLKATFGEKFTTKFVKGLSDHTESNAEQNSSAAQDAGGNEFGLELMEALREKSAEDFQAQLSSAVGEIAELKKSKQTLEALVDKLGYSAEDLPSKTQLQEFKGKEGVKAILKVNKAYQHYKAYQSMLETGNAAAYTNAGTTIEVADLKSEFGTYLNVQQNIQILAQIFAGFTSAKHFKTVLATTEYRASQALITSVVQQFNSEWTPSGKTKFQPLVIKNRRHKINVPIKPADVLDSYIFYLYDEGLSPDQMPITKYIIDTLIIPQVLMDIEYRMLFKGKYIEHDDVAENAPGTPPEDGMDGVETILVAEKAKTNSKVNFFDPGFAFDFKTADDALIIKFMNAFVDWIKPIYRGFKMDINCSPEFFTAYQRAYKEKWGQNSGQSGDFGTSKIDFSPNHLVPLDGMYGSPILFATPANNKIRLRHKNEVPNIINDIQKHNYTVKVFGEFWFAAGFAIADAIHAYVPAGYNPQTMLGTQMGDHDQFPGEEIIDDGSGA